MSSPRKHRYFPSTTQTLTVRIACGRHRHKIVWTHGALSLPGHTQEELATALLSHNLQVPLSPCLQVWAYFKQRPDHQISIPSFLPQSIHSAMIVARFARRHRDARVRQYELRQKIAITYFEKLIDAMPKSCLPALTRELIASLFPTSRHQHPLLRRDTSGWAINQAHPFLANHDDNRATFLRKLDQFVTLQNTHIREASRG